MFVLVGMVLPCYMLTPNSANPTDGVADGHLKQTKKNMLSPYFILLLVEKMEFL